MGLRPQRPRLRSKTEVWGTDARRSPPESGTAPSGPDGALKLDFGADRGELEAHNRP